MASRTVELLVQVVDNASAEISRIKGSLSSMLGPYKTLIAGAAGIATVGSAFRKFVMESSEAEEALARFDLAFRNLGANAGVPKRAMQSFAEEVQRTTAFSDEAVLELQGTLLRFGSVTGATFERTRGVVIDVAAALRMDLGTAAETVGRALENPAQGMRMLRSLGVVLSASQQDVVKNLMEAGRAADAQKLILDELEKRYKGAAEVAGNTFTGALAKLKNAWGEVFEGPDKLAPITKGMNDLSATLQDPGIKNAIQTLFGEMARLIGETIKLLAQLVRGFDLLGEAAARAWEGITGGSQTTSGALAKQFDADKRALAAAQQELAKYKRIRDESAAAGGSGGRQNAALAQGEIAKLEARILKLKYDMELTQGAMANAAGMGAKALTFAPEAAAAPAAGGAPTINEAAIKAQKKALDEAKNKWQETMTGIYDSAGTELDKVQRELYETRQAVADAFGSQLINEDQMHELFRLAGENSGEAFAAAFEAANRPMFDKLTKDMTAELEGALDGVAVDIPTVKIEIDTEEVLRARAMTDSFIGALTDGLKNAATQGKLSMKDLVQFMISQLLSKALMNAIDSLGKAIKDAFSASSSGGSGGWLSGAVSFVGSLFGGKAGGGFAAGGLAHAAAGGMTLVGEEGPELVALPKGSRVYSNSASRAMGQANVNYAPVTNVAIMAKDTDAATLRAEFMVMLERNNERERKKTLEIWDRNGFGRMR